MIIAAWLIIGTQLHADASQTVRAIPFASFEHCERQMMRVFRDAEPSPVTIKPYCTTVAPSFWVQKS